MPTNPQCTNLIAFVKSHAQAKGYLPEAYELAKTRKESPGVALFFKHVIDTGTLTLKTGVDAGDTMTSGWGSQLVSYGPGTELLALQSSTSVFGQLQPFMHTLPFRVSTPIETAGPACYWVGESGGKGISKLTLGTNLVLDFYKQLVAVVVTDELLRFSQTGTDAALKNAMRRALVRTLDTQFLDPSITLIPGVRPASITNGDNVRVSTGSTAAQKQSDFEAMVASLTSWESLHWIMSPVTAVALASTFNTAGGRQFPNININGGELLGIPVLVSSNISGFIVLMDAAAIVYQREVVNISTSNEVTLEMESAPAAGEQSPITALTNLKSMWQNNMRAILSEYGINYQRVHDDSVCSMVVTY